jgi:signal transduction histidine kinase
MNAGASPHSINPTDLPGLCLAVTEHAPLPIATVDGVTHFVCYANPAFCRMMSKPAEQLVGKPLSELLPEKDACVALLDRVHSSKKAQSHTEREDSKPHPVFWSYVMWPMLTEERLVGVMIQISETAKVHDQTVAMNEALMIGSVRQHELTEAADALNVRLQQEIGVRQRIEEALQQAQARLTDQAGLLQELVTTRTSELLAANQELEALVYSIAHDLRAPMRAMQGFASLLVEQGAPGLSDNGRELARRIDQSAQFMHAMLSGLLVFTRASQERMELTAVQPQAVLESVLEGLRADIEGKNAHVEISGPSWPVVRAHAPALRDALFHLLGNALKFTSPGVRPQVRLWAEDRAEHVRVWVEDNGPGIAPDYHTQIFRLFIRLGGDRYPGTGIGLAIVQKEIERMGGRVGVESVAGQGSRFWLELRKA